MNEIPVLTIIHNDTKDSPVPDTIVYKLDWLGFEKRKRISLMAMEDTPYFIDRTIKEMYDDIMRAYIEKCKQKEIKIEQTWEEYETNNSGR